MFEKFLSNLLSYGVMHPNRFIVSIPLPDLITDAIDGNSELTTLQQVYNAASAFSGGSTTTANQLKFRCTVSGLPGTNIESFNVTENAQRFKVANNSAHTEQLLTFLQSASLYEKKVMDLWVKSIINETSRKAAYYDDYVTNISISVVDEFDQTQYSCTLIKAYPILLEGVTLDKSSQSEASNLSTSFTFKRVIDDNTPDASATNSPSLATALSSSSVGEVISDATSGDYSGAALAARKTILKASNGTLTSDLSSSAVTALSTVLSQTSGLTASDATAVLSTFKKGVATNAALSASDRTSIISIINDML